MAEGLEGPVQLVIFYNAAVVLPLDLFVNRV
jgi:hypothetical protein